MNLLCSLQYISDGIHDSTHTAVLSSYTHPFETFPFVRQTIGLQDTSHRRAATVCPTESPSPGRGCYVCGSIRHGYKSCTQSQPQVMQSKARPLLTLMVHIDSICALTAVVERSINHCFIATPQNTFIPGLSHHCGAFVATYYQVGALNLWLTSRPDASSCTRCPSSATCPETWS